MRFRWDWLRPVVTAPYVPTIGPVHPSVLTNDLFTDILRTAGGRRFLPYDKDLRWSEAKDECVLAEEITHRQGETLIPTVVRRGAGTVKVYAYGVESDSRVVASDMAQKLCANYGAAKALVVRFLGPEYGTRFAQGARIQLQDFSGWQDCPLAPSVAAFTDLPAATRQDFSRFAQRMADDGFGFLYGHMQSGTIGPVLVASVDDRVVGAIGPMEIRPDAIGHAQLMPQYFAVLPEHRGQGFGRALWRGAMSWGKSHGAAYQLLQTVVGGASDSLCQREGLQSLGFVVATPA